MDRKSLGKLGEDKAAEYLQERGYKILVRNWKCKLGEIDIVAFKGGTFVFVEVKTLAKPYALSHMPYADEKYEDKDGLRPTAYGLRQGLRPEDHMTPWKLKKITRLADYYLAINKRTGAPWQIDLVAIEVGEEQSPNVRHIERVS